MGFTYSGAMSGVLPQLSVTGPAAVLIAAATAANVLAGAVALRLLGGPAYRGLSELALSGFAAAVVLDAGVLFVLEAPASWLAGAAGPSRDGGRRIRGHAAAAP